MEILKGLFNASSNNTLAYYRDILVSLLAAKPKVLDTFALSSLFFYLSSYM